jgi:hypothetical protein
MNKTLLFTFSIIFLFINKVSAWNTPEVVAPLNAANTFTGVTINWNAVNNSQGYQLEIDTLASFSTPAKLRFTKDYISASSANEDTEHSLNNLLFVQKYYWKVRAYINGDTSAWSATSLFSTFAIVTFVNPENGVLNLGTNGITLNWAAYEGVSQYQLQVDTTNLFNSPILINVTKSYLGASSDSADTEHTIFADIENRTYFWRVRALSVNDASEWNSRWFSTGTNSFAIPETPALILPFNDETEVPTIMQFVWNSSLYANSYQLYVDENSDFTSPLVYTTTDTSRIVVILQPNQKYYWCVRAFNTPSIVSSWSQIKSFTTVTVFEGPNLLAPSFNENNVSLNADFDWEDIEDATAYIISIDTSSDFSTQVLDTTEFSEYSTALNKGSKRYYWRVMAQRDTQNSIWSDVYEFKTESAASTFSAFDKPMVSVFPNPSSGTLFVSSEQLIRDIMVFDNGGKLMVDYNNSNAQKQLHLDLHTWATGTYFLIVKMNDGTEAKHNFFVKGN